MIRAFWRSPAISPQKGLRLVIQFAALGLIALRPNEKAHASAPEADIATIQKKFEDWTRVHKEKDLVRTMDIFAVDAISMFAGAKDAILPR